MKKRRERGATMVESLMAIAVLLMVFFGMYRIFDFTVANMICEYASFYAAKSWSLGYRPATTRRAARVAAMPASGRDYSVIRPTASLNSMQSDSAARARDYMQYDRAGVYGVNFEYWGEQDVRPNEPHLSIYGETGIDKASGIVRILNKPLWPFETRKKAPTVNIPGGTTQMINYSNNYLISDNDAYHRSP
jgi:hypothetical protein